MKLLPFSTRAWPPHRPEYGPLGPRGQRILHGLRLRCGIAEYGGYVWDAVRQRGQALISANVQDQLDRAKQALSGLPGVFINDGYEYSIKANTYEEGLPVPLPTPLMQRFLADHGLDRLTFHQTSIDTTIVASDRNKGTGLLALLAWAGLPDASTYAIGDSEPDLAMFRVADRCFAPAHIGCAGLARISRLSYRGPAIPARLLHIARSLVHAGGSRCEHCAAGDAASAQGSLFFDMLRTADEPRWRHVLRRAPSLRLRRVPSLNQNRTEKQRLGSRGQIISTARLSLAVAI